MARHRRMLAPINTKKHYVQLANTGVTSGGVQNNLVIDAVVAPATANTRDVQEGAVIKAVYVEMWIGGDASSTESQFILIIEKKRDGEVDPTNANLANLMAYSNKKNVLYTTQGIVPAMLDGGMTVPVIRQWILIPKGKQRFGLDDQLMISTAGVGVLRLCGFVTYKEYN